jgi:hypothetical protein
LFEHKSPVGRLYVTLREAGFHPERDWPLREGGVTYRVDLALPLDNNQGWLPIMLTSPDLPAPPQTLHFTPDSDPADCAWIIRQRLAETGD